MLSKMLYLVWSFLFFFSYSLPSFLSSFLPFFPSSFPASFLCLQGQGLQNEIIRDEVWDCILKGRLALWSVWLSGRFEKHHFNYLLCQRHFSLSLKKETHLGEWDRLDDLQICFLTAVFFTMISCLSAKGTQLWALSLQMSHSTVCRNWVWSHEPNCPVIESEN